MPKISDIEETPNPNAVKFILREAVSNGVAKQYSAADLAVNDPLAKSLFDVGHVVSVFYMDRMITVEKEDEGDWDRPFYVRLPNRGEHHNHVVRITGPSSHHAPILTSIASRGHASHRLACRPLARTVRAAAEIGASAVTRPAHSSRGA